MKKFLLSCSTLFAILTASAQFSAGIGGTYSMYKGEFQKSAPGIQARLAYQLQDRSRLGLNVTYGLPITQSYPLTLQSNNGSASKDVTAEDSYKFLTFDLMGNYDFIGDQDATVSVYGKFGIGLVLVNYDQTIKDNYDKNTFSAPEMGSGSVNGFTLNLGLGGEYNLGRSAIFAEAGIALPANKVNYSFYYNPIPFNINFSLGARYKFGE